MTITVNPTDWRQRGNCLGVDAEVFFPHRGEDTRIAKQICNGTTDGESCPVRDQCLNHALDNDERIGVWGGTSERERRRIRRTIRVSAA